MEQILKQFDLMEKALRENEKKLALISKKIASLIKKGKANKVIISGAGDKYLIGLISQYIWKKHCNFPLEVIHSKSLQELKEYSRNSIIIFLSQSGLTKDTVNAIKKVKRVATYLVGITNLKEKKKNSIYLVESKGEVICLNIEKELSLPSTITFFSSLHVLNFLLLYILKELEIELKVNLNVAKKLKEVQVSKKFTNYCKRIAKKLRNEESIVILGESINYGVARKLSLIFGMEGAKVKAFPLMLEEFPHSLIALAKNEPFLIVLEPINGLKGKYIEKLKTWKKIEIIKKDKFGKFNYFTLPYLYSLIGEYIFYYLAKIRGEDFYKSDVVKKVRD